MPLAPERQRNHGARWALLLILSRLFCHPFNDSFDALAQPDFWYPAHFPPG
jgi:hypothetical protein